MLNSFDESISAWTNSAVMWCSYEVPKQSSELVPTRCRSSYLSCWSPSIPQWIATIWRFVGTNHLRDHVNVLHGVPCFWTWYDFLCKFTPTAEWMHIGDDVDVSSRSVAASSQYCCLSPAGFSNLKVDTVKRDISNLKYLLTIYIFWNWKIVRYFPNTVHIGAAPLYFNDWIFYYHI